MSGFGAGVGKAVGSLGGPQIAAIVVAGGLVVGAIGGGLVGGGGSGQQGTSQATLSIYPCPDSGPALATVGSGQKFLVTGKNADGSWARIYYPLPGRTEAWVPSGPLQIDGSLDSQPVVPCSPVVAAAGASVEPSSSLTAIEDNSPSPSRRARRRRRPTAAPPSPASTSARPSPAVRSATASGRRARSRSASGRPMRRRSPTSCSRTASRVPRTSRPSPWHASAGATPGVRRSPPTRTGSPVPAACASTSAPRTATRRRTPPGSRRARSMSPTARTPDPSWPRFGPLRRPCPPTSRACQSKPKATAISVEATDVDGVAGATLHYKLPGDGSFRDTKMTRNGNRWRATVTPVNQRPNADGKASYYVTSDDDLGKSAKSATQTFTVNRCNFPATLLLPRLGSTRVCACRR